MITLLLSLRRLLIAVWHGVKEDLEFRVLFYVLLTLLTSATLFYWRVEGWSLIDSLYFSVMTMSTIGYGDFVPTTTLSKLFTVIFAILSIGVFVAVVSKLVNIVLKEKKDRASKIKDYADSHGFKVQPKHEKDTAKKKDNDLK